MISFVWSYESYYKSLRILCTKSYWICCKNIPIRIVKCNCIHNILVSFQYVKLFSWGCIPHFTCSVIASCYETWQNGEYHEVKKLIFKLIKRLFSCLIQFATLHFQQNYIAIICHLELHKRTTDVWIIPRSSFLARFWEVTGILARGYHCRPFQAWNWCRIFRWAWQLYNNTAPFQNKPFLLLSCIFFT